MTLKVKSTLFCDSFVIDKDLINEINRPINQLASKDTMQPKELVKPKSLFSKFFGNPFTRAS
jgi:hypothetical protein